MAHPEIIQRRRAALTLVGLLVGGVVLALLLASAVDGTQRTGDPMQRLLAERAAAADTARRETDPLNWAIAQALHGEALKTSAEMHGRNPELAGEAIAAYRRALEVLTYEQRPHLWSLGQLNLAEALAMRGVDLGDAGALTAAQAAFAAAENGFRRQGNDVLAEAAREGRENAARELRVLSGD